MPGCTAAAGATVMAMGEWPATMVKAVGRLRAVVADLLRQMANRLDPLDRKLCPACGGLCFQPRPFGVYCACNNVRTSGSGSVIFEPLRER